MERHRTRVAKASYMTSGAITCVIADGLKLAQEKRGVSIFRFSFCRDLWGLGLNWI
jgi:hypothetical protein